MIPALRLRRGNTIVYNGEIYKVIETQHITPGNWRGFVQAKLKSLKTGKIAQNRFGSDELVEPAHLDARTAQYLYKDDTGFHFMDLGDYNSFCLTEEIVGDGQYYMKENQEIDIDFYEGVPVGLELPKQVILKVTESMPGVKGDSVSNMLKPATLETGLKIQVPLFVKEGDLLKVDTETGEYLGRA
ncbi:MAG: elongation factor P [Candidatus Omnitrophica bacterium]|nr:elongation factor P [Candidatus Omnitrophota bacterium]